MFIFVELWVVKYLLMVIMWIFLLVNVFRYIGIVVVKVLFLLVCILGIFLLWSMILFINCMWYGYNFNICFVVFWMIVKVFGSNWFNVFFFWYLFLNLVVFVCNCLLVNVVIWLVYDLIFFVMLFKCFSFFLLFLISEWIKLVMCCVIFFFFCVLFRLCRFYFLFYY